MKPLQKFGRGLTLRQVENPFMSSRTVDGIAISICRTRGE